jgi:hypothetical protein
VKNDIQWDDSKCQTVTATGTAITCRCNWASGLCGFTVDNCNIDDSVITCAYTPPEISTCSNGVAQVTIHTESTDLMCIPDNTVKTLQCGRPVIELPFFTLAQSLLAVAVIVLIYIMLRRLRKKDGRHRHVFK